MEKKTKHDIRGGGKTAVKKWTIDLLYVIAGSLIYSAGVHIFTAPNDIAPGGIVGIATIINHFDNFPIGTMYAIMNLPVLILGFIFLKRGMMIKTIVSVIVITAATDFLLENLPEYVGDEGDMILVAIFGAVMLGVGLGLVYVRDATSGGSDIITRILHKKMPHYSLGKIMLVFDGAIIIVAMIVFQSVEAGLYAIITMYVKTHVVDMILYGNLEGKLLFIFSNKYEEITQKIISEQKRGVTLLSGRGAFSGDKREVICCAVHKNQYVKIKRLVNQIDPKAFIVITNAGEVLGAGFSVNKEN